MYILTYSLGLDDHNRVETHKFDLNWDKVVGDGPLWSVRLPVRGSATHRIAVVDLPGRRRDSLLVTGLLEDVVYQGSSQADVLV